MLGDRIRETTNTTGLGTISLGGAPAGYQTCVQGVGTGKTIHFLETDGAGSWELWRGVVTAGTPDTLTKGALIASSTGSAISWGAGSKTIVGLIDARSLVSQEPTFCGTSTGSANAQAITPIPGVSTLRAGMTFRFIPGFANTGAATLAVGSASPVAMFKSTALGAPAALASGDLQPLTIVTVVFDGTQFQVVDGIAPQTPLTATQKAAMALSLFNFCR